VSGVSQSVPAISPLPGAQCGQWAWSADAKTRGTAGSGPQAFLASDPDCMAV